MNAPLIHEPDEKDTRRKFFRIQKTSAAGSHLPPLEQVAKKIFYTNKKPILELRQQVNQQP